MLLVPAPCGPWQLASQSSSGSCPPYIGRGPPLFGPGEGRGGNGVAVILGPHPGLLSMTSESLTGTVHQLPLNSVWKLQQVQTSVFHSWGGLLAGGLWRNPAGGKQRDDIFGSCFCCLEVSPLHCELFFSRGLPVVV